MSPKELLFENYKAFNEPGSIKLRPVTLILGKNSSGKTSLCKLVKMISTCMSGHTGALLPLSADDVSFGNSLLNLFHNHQTTGLKLGAVYDFGKGSDNRHDYSVTVKAEYFINESQLYAYSYEVTKNYANGDDQRSAIMKGSEEKPLRPDGLIDAEALGAIDVDPAELKFSTSYIGPARRCLQDPVIRPETASSATATYDGSDAYRLLLNSFTGDKRTFRNVSDWMDAHLENQRILFKPLLEVAGLYGVYVDHNGVLCPINEVGQGISQLLPIVTDAFAGTSDVSIIEQPVLHLHPACHADVAALLGTQAKKRGRNVVIESHSENMLLCFREMVTNPEVDFNKEDIVIYFVDSDDEGTYLREITIDSQGELSEWPEGVYGEGFDLISKIIRNGKRK